MTPAAHHPATRWGLLAILLLPWVHLFLTQPVNVDILWLSLVMERLLSGQSMNTHAYETNPPLSALVYIIPAFLHKLTGLPLQISTILQSLLLLAGSFAMLGQALKNFSFLQRDQRDLLLIGFVAAATICSMTFFGERDHYIGLVLPAFILIQLSITQGVCTHKRFMWIFLMIGTLLILVKPPHGLLPTLMILHRIIKRRDLSTLKDPDFIALSTMTILCLGVTTVFFPDYIGTVMPDVINYYFPQIGIDYIWLPLLKFIFFVSLLGGGTYAVLSKSPLSGLMKLFIFAALVTVVPIVFQGKGFYYHYLPTLILLWMGASLLLYETLKLSVRAWAASLTILAVTVVCYLCAPMSLNLTRFDKIKTEYASIEAVVRDANTNTANKSFWIFDNSMDLAQQIHTATGYEFGSRFANLWFLDKLYNQGTESDYLRFSGMVAEDLNTYQPKVVLILAPEYFLREMEVDFDLIKFFSKNDAFKDAWAPYALTGKITYNEQVYYGNFRDPFMEKPFLIFTRQSKP